MITLISNSKCYHNSRNYVARITGRDSKMTFNREFLGKTRDVDEEGLYEICNIDHKGNKDQIYRVVAHRPDGELVSLQAGGDCFGPESGKEAAMIIAKRIDAGESIDDIVAVSQADDDTWGYKIRSKAEAKKAVVAATIDAVVEQCVSALSALDEKQRKAALTQIKTRFAPAKPAPTDTPVEAPAAEVS
jgi:hypothetical protein